MNIGVIDDNLKELNIIYSLINDELKDTFNSYVIDTFNTTDQFDFNKYYDVLFLDIDMPKDGIELAKEYISIHKDSNIIFVTNKTERVFETFDVHPYYFIKKDTIFHTLPSVIKSLVNEMKTEEEFIKITFNKKTINLSLDKIMYIKSEQHYCHIITLTRTYTIRDKLNNIITLINNNFCRIHNRIIVNWQYVSEFADNTVKVNNHYLPVSRKYQKSSKDSYIKHLGSTIK